ncbi:hypothetical protein [Microtetraspora sp. NBRC 13810]|uniref:hypothetical protein n=1 Tax=Microtetraspora sp. NBRC 13810 TaxID=3030990 RepID=UPI0033246EB3
MSQPASNALTATAAVTANAPVDVYATVTASGTPLTTATTGVNVPADGSATQAAALAAGATLPVPPMTLLITPTATGTVALKAGAFNLDVGNQAYLCSPGTGGGPSLNVVVASGTASTTPSATPSSTTTSGTPTPTQTTPRPTTTTTHTVTATPPGGNEQVTRTPGGGAATGGGGEIGPDGRMFLLVGSLLVMGAGAGGLFLRRRTAAGPRS